ncbi:MAG: sigma-70 family RNA polymerase sigma factor [Tyzzerella sp.]|nr:sigma-70 family RNA polymerase sigma factor [Tyzzerella sp.]
MLSIEDVYKEYSQIVYRYLLSITRSEQLSEELTQETFYQAIRTVNRFDGSCKVSTWLCAIAKNVWKSYQRKHPYTENLAEEVSLGNHTESVVFSNLSRIEVFKKIHLLEGEAKEVVYLRLFGDLSFKEIGEILGRTENWARVTYYRGKEKLRKELDADEK